MVIIIQIIILKVQVMFTNDPRVNLGLCDARSFESSIGLYMPLFGCTSLVFGFVWL